MKAWFWRQMEIQGKAEIANGEAELAMGKELNDAISSMYQKAVGKYGDDTKGVIFDVAAVALSVFLVVTGTAEVLGVMAAIGGALLLILDGTA